MQLSLSAADEDLQSFSLTHEETTSEKLFRHLFGACNILRGPINQDEYKSYAIPVLFFKRLSDVYDEETSKALEESGGDTEYAAFPEQHRFVIPEDCPGSARIGSKFINFFSSILTAQEIQKEP